MRPSRVRISRPRRYDRPGSDLLEPERHAPPAGGFGGEKPEGPVQVHHVPPLREPSNALHVFFIVASLLAAAMLVFVLLMVRQKQRLVRAAEAKNALGQIARNVSEAHARGETCPSARAIPADFEAVRGKAYPSREEEWRSDPGWACASFSMPQAQYYQYRLEVTDGFVTIKAAGDLDGDDVRSTYELHGHVDRAARRIVFDTSIQESNPGE